MQHDVLFDIFLFVHCLHRSSTYEIQVPKSSSSLSLSHAKSKDVPNSFSLSVPIIHRFRISLPSYFQRPQSRCKMSNAKGFMYLLKIVEDVIFGNSFLDTKDLLFNFNRNPLSFLKLAGTICGP